MLIITNSLNAQEKYFFEKLSVSDGLSNSVVLCTYQDHLGYLWIGTLDGLNRYDGYDIKLYKNIPGDSTSLPYNIILSLTEDSNGNLLIGTIDNISKYNRVTNNFTSIPVDKGAMVNNSDVVNILVDSKDRLWIATKFTGLQLFNKAKNEFNIIKFSDYSGNEISSLYENFAFNITELANGNILTASPEAGIFIYNSASNVFQPYFTNSKLNLTDIIDIFEDSRGRLWFGGIEDIVLYNPITYDMKSLNLSGKLTRSEENTNFQKFFESENNRILFQSSIGIFETDLNANNFSLITDKIANINPINFYRDNFGIYWIATAGNGLFKFDPTKKPFRFFRIEENEQSETKSNPVTDIVKHPFNKDRLFLSLMGQGIYQYDKNLNEFKKIVKQDGRNLLIDDKENLWFTFNNKLHEFNIKTGVNKSFEFEKSTTQPLLL